jgi:hypothetical protein
MALNLASLLGTLYTTVVDYIDTQFATKPSLVTAGTAGTAAGNAGTATTAARSDHIHRFFVGTATRAAGSTGSHAITGVGFKPVLIKIQAQRGTILGGGDIGMSIGYGTSSSNRFCVSLYNYDNGGDDEPRVLSSTSTIVTIKDQTDTDIAVADVTSLDADGLTISWSVNDAGAPGDIELIYTCWG